MSLLTFRSRVFRWFCATAALFISPLLSHAAETPYLAVTHSNGNVIVTWTNVAEIFLEESTNLTSWTRSTRPFVYFGGRSRFRVTAPLAKEFFRIGSSNQPPPSLSTDDEVGRKYISWPFASTNVFVEARPALTTNAPWRPATNTVVVSGGYKQTTFASNSSGPVYFRLSRPLNHVLIIGQSLSIGATALPALSKEQPYQNKMFVGQQLDGNVPLTEVPPDDLSALSPLEERDFPSQHSGETIASGFANSVSFRAGAGQHDLLVSNAGRGSSNYEDLKRGTAPYSRATNQIAAGKNLGRDLGYAFQAVFVVHGEGDTGNRLYDENIRQWQADYEQDARQLTEQVATVPMFHSQISSWGSLNANLNNSSLLMLAEHEANPFKTILGGPKYFLPHSDGLHLTAESYRWLGEYYAKAYYQHIVQGTPWTPLRPASLVRTGAVITVTFTGNAGSLFFDTNRVSDPRGELALPVGLHLVSTVVPWAVTSVNIDPTNDTMSIEGHSFRTGDELLIHSGTLPPQLSANQPCYVSAVVDSNRVQLSAARGGAALDFTSAGTNIYIYTPARQDIGPFGFEYSDEQGEGVPWRCRTTVIAADIVNSNQVRVTLSNVPTGTNRRLRYAYTAKLRDDGGFSGPTDGPRGCLRDSDDTPSLCGNPLFNWCVHFDKPVP